jgi:hypothetical protein
MRVETNAGKFALGDRQVWQLRTKLQEDGMLAVEQLS